MKQLIVNKPEDPVKFLIDQMQQPERKSPPPPTLTCNLCVTAMRIVLVGPPGSKRKEIALALQNHFNEEGKKDYQFISVGDLFHRQILKKNQEFCDDIKQSLESYSYVSDEIVIKLVSQQIVQFEKEKKSWIIEGFPRTEAQAIALQKLGVIPDKFILLTQTEDDTYSKLMQNMSGDGDKPNNLLVCDDRTMRARLAKNALLEYNMNIEGVKRISQGMIT